MTIINAHPLTTTSSGHDGPGRARRARTAAESIRHGGAGLRRTRPSTESMSLATALTLTGLFAGFFATYSVSVVLGLARVDDVTYVTTFQAINETVRNPAFAVFFFGCVPSIVWAVAAHRRRDRRTLGLLGAGLASCAGVVAITFLGNVPLNEELGAVTDLSEATAAAARADFEGVWNQLNLARAVLSTIGLAAIATAASLRPSAP